MPWETRFQPPVQNSLHTLLNCHAGGVQGKAHPAAISDILKAAKIIEAAQQKEQDDEDDTA